MPAAPPLRDLTLVSAAQGLERGDLSARGLLETALAAAEAAPASFTRLDPSAARRAADASDARRRAGRALSPWDGAPVSLKDLFDVAGEPTRAGAPRRLAGAPPAKADAPAVRRLREAGFVFVGRTHMSEFAFTGLGLNPHQTRLGNPLDPDRAPGGSSSGAAASVALGQALAALGTDTGGSVRIPAAFCGLVGFKPTKGRIPCEGVFPLSETLDSVGPIASTVADCRILDAILADGSAAGAEGAERTLGHDAPSPLRGARFAAADDLVLDEAEPEVAAAYEAALAALARAGARVERTATPEFRESLAATAAAGGAIANAEAFAFHRREGLLNDPEAYDPQVLARIRLGGDMAAAGYLDLLDARRRLSRSLWARLEGFTALLFPTCPIRPPRFEDLDDPRAFQRLNALALRNCGLVNFLGGCAASLPTPGAVPGVGLTLAGPPLSDARILDAAAAAETALGLPRPRTYRRERSEAGKPDQQAS